MNEFNIGNGTIGQMNDWSKEGGDTKEDLKAKMSKFFKNLKSLLKDLLDKRSKFF